MIWPLNDNPSSTGFYVHTSSARTAVVSDEYIVGQRQSWRCPALRSKITRFKQPSTSLKDNAGRPLLRPRLNHPAGKIKRNIDACFTKLMQPKIKPHTPDSPLDQDASRLENSDHRHHAMRSALFAMNYNFVRIRKTLRTTPAMAAGAVVVWKIDDIVDVLESWEAAN